MQALLRQQARTTATLVAVLLACQAWSQASGEDAVAAAPLEGVHAASRLGSRATFGADLASIESIYLLGEEAWIEQQFLQPISRHDDVVEQLLTLRDEGAFDSRRGGSSIGNVQAVFGRLAWWHRSITAEDQLRQRVAYALSQIFVVSDEINPLLIPPYATSNYYDLLLYHAFGNFRELLLGVTLHPSMGVYLSHLNNARSDPDAGTFPDENFAREVMQLFSIGLFELNDDGSERLGTDGQPLATYDNRDIAEFAKVFTGLSWGGDNRRFGTQRYVYQSPMQMFDAFHEPGEKTLLYGQVIPAGQSGMADVENAIDNLFHHPNVGPFIGKQLIQRLVSSNPSPAYVQRVAHAFADNGASVRGDMQAVIKAVLLDPEARARPGSRSTAGKLREPVLRYTSMLRQLGVSTPDGFYANSGRVFQERVQQHPLSAPSVFNFYLPAHQPVGEIAALGLVAPEFQITNSNSIIEISNLMHLAVLGDVLSDVTASPFARATLTLDDFIEVAADVDGLLDRMDTVFTYGTLSDATRAAIRNLLVQIPDDEQRVRTAAYVLLISPDYAVEL